MADPLRGLDVGRINVDLMYGLPYQAIQGIETSVDTALTMRSERVPLFGCAQNDFIPAVAAVFDKYQAPNTQRYTWAFSRQPAKDSSFRWIGIMLRQVISDVVVIALIGHKDMGGEFDTGGLVQGSAGDVATDAVRRFRVRYPEQV